MLGIGLVNYNRFGATMACAHSVRRFTASPHRLIIADDGSPDGLRSYAISQGFEVVGKYNRGVAWNYNRALYTLRDCDPIILVEVDTWPIVYGWEKPWVQAAWMHGQVNYAYDIEAPKAGDGTPERPFLCERWGSQIVATSALAFRLLGYQDPRFYRWKYSIAHAEWTFRLSRAFRWPRATVNDTPPCLNSGVAALRLGSVYNGNVVQESSDLLVEIVDGTTYRDPWRDDKEKHEFLSELM